MKILVICVINSSRHRKYFVRGHIQDLFVSKPSLARISLVRVLTQTAREYNPVQSTLYDVNYIFDKKTTEDDSGSEGNFGDGTASAREE